MIVTYHFFTVLIFYQIIYVAAKATYIRLLHGQIGILEGFFGPSSVHRGRTHIVDEICSVHPPLHTLKIWGGGVYSPRS